MRASGLTRCAGELGAQVRHPQGDAGGPGGAHQPRRGHTAQIQALSDLQQAALRGSVSGRFKGHSATCVLCCYLMRLSD